MQMTGHKTRSVFERYNIVSECDLVEAAKKLDTLQPIPPSEVRLKPDTTFVGPAQAGHYVCLNFSRDFGGRIEALAR